MHLWLLDRRLPLFQNCVQALEHLLNTHVPRCITDRLPAHGVSWGLFRAAGGLSGYSTNPRTMPCVRSTPGLLCLILWMSGFRLNAFVGAFFPPQITEKETRHILMSEEDETNADYVVTSVIMSFLQYRHSTPGRKVTMINDQQSDQHFAACVPRIHGSGKHGLFHLQVSEDKEMQAQGKETALAAFSSLAACYIC